MTTDAMDDTLDKMQAAVARLDRLLKDRHPGLMSWNLALMRAIDSFSAIVGTGKEKETGK